jgi:hypothetical protein
LFLLVRTTEELEEYLSRSATEMADRATVWVVYPKGRRQGITETHVRETLRARGMVDTKVASVSDELTALRFSRRNAERRQAEKH